ncbi:MAG: hypothetical protein HYX60_04240 [Legionella longbeachae]|nr:hypothetical protein [Legionella longbeachae]
MPLVLSLYGSSSKSKNIHLIIDRNNLIFSVSKFDTSMMTQERKEKMEKLPYIIINRIGEVANSVIQNYKISKHYKPLNKIFARTTDPRHDSREHLCEWDKGNAHYHLLFKNDVNYDLLKKIFRDSSWEACSELISKTCINELLDIAENYFDQSSSDSNMQQIENEYRQDKKNQDINAKISVLSNSLFMLKNEQNDEAKHLDKRLTILSLL